MKKKRVVILGAGFSMPAGIPPQDKLLSRAIGIQAKSLDSSQASLPMNKDIVETFLKVLYGRGFRRLIRCGLILLEDVYTVLDANILRQKNVGIFSIKNLYRIREALDGCILYVVNKAISLRDIKKYKAGLRRAIFAENTDVSFISTNWDFLLEKSLVSMGYQVDYSVDLEHVNGSAEKGGREILVLKPHGSLNWKLCPVCETIYTTMMGRVASCGKCDRKYQSIRLNYLSDLFRLKTEIPVLDMAKLSPIFVTPTFLKSNFAPQLGMVFQKMYQELSSADEIVFIGYSLPVSDHDVRELLLRANASNPKQNIFVVSKTTKKREKEKLMNNYCTIYSTLKATDFNWKGFIT